jgi:MoaA/NifB/PqqE/SkfB family radical SAM enzyme
VSSHIFPPRAPREASNSQPREFEPGIPSVDWWVTSRCNLSCDFCYGPKPASDPVELREMIAARIRESTARVVTFCGGEPLLVKKLAEYAQWQRDSGKLAVLNTNGELLRRRFGVLRSIPFDIIGVSIDGPDASTHRAMRGPNADFAETLAAVRWLRDHHPGVKRKVGTVVSAVNAARVQELALIVRELNPDVWRIYQYSPWGPQNHGHDRHTIGEDGFAAAVRRATAAAQPVAVKPSTTATTGGCLIVDPNGRILCQQRDGYVPVGSCLDEPLEDIWQRAPQQSIVRANKVWLQEIGNQSG